MKGYDKQFVVQGVHMIFDGYQGLDWGGSGGSGAEPAAEPGVRRSRLVFIGENLPREQLFEGFKACWVKEKIE